MDGLLTNIQLRIWFPWNRNWQKLQQRYFSLFILEKERYYNAVWSFCSSGISIIWVVCNEVFLWALRLIYICYYNWPSSAFLLFSLLVYKLGNIFQLGGEVGFQHRNGKMAACVGQFRNIIAAQMEGPTLPRYEITHWDRNKQNENLFGGPAISNQG